MCFRLGSQEAFTIQKRELQAESRRAKVALKTSLDYPSTYNHEGCNQSIFRSECYP